MKMDQRREPPDTGSPMELTAAFLDFLRDTVLWKIDGLTDDQVRESIPIGGWSMLGMVKHIAYVERWWFQAHFMGEAQTYPWTKEDPDADWRIEPNETTTEIIALYQGEANRSRQIAAAHDWNDLAQDTSRDQQKSLGWIMTHMIEETARHCGHLDLARQHLDGQTGE